MWHYLVIWRFLLTGCRGIDVSSWHHEPNADLPNQPSVKPVMFLCPASVSPCVYSVSVCVCTKILKLWTWFYATLPITALLYWIARALYKPLTRVHVLFPRHVIYIVDIALNVRRKMFTCHAQIHNQSVTTSTCQCPCVSSRYYSKSHSNE